MKVSLFFRDPPCGGEPSRLRFNPYVAIGRWFELCIDRDGFLLIVGRHSCGYIVGAGWHREVQS